MAQRFVAGRATRFLVICGILSLVPARGARAQREPSPSGLKVTAQIVTGTVVAPVAFVAGGLATKWVARHLGAGEEQQSRLAYFGAYALTGIATAAAPLLIVRGGNYPASLTGTVLGAAGAAVLVVSGRALYQNNARCGVICTTWGIVTFALPAVGGTILYNRSR